MPILRITNGFDRLSDANLGTRSNSIHAAMTGNSNFPTPTPALATLLTAINDFITALAAAENGSNYDKAVKNQKRDELIDILHSLGNYVLFTANGDVIIAKSSGFSISKTPSPSVLEKPVNLQLQDGMNAGELNLVFDSVGGARGFVYQYTPDPVLNESPWLIETGTSRKIVLSGLESGKKYWVRVIAIGAYDQKAISDAVSRLVQ